MTQLILTVRTGIHDAGAALNDDYTLLAAVQLERLTRRKNDGSEYPDRCIEEVLSIAGATRKDVDVVGASRCEFPAIFYRNIRGVRWINEQFRRHIKKRTRRFMMSEFLRYNTARVDDIFNVDKFRRDSGFRDDAGVFFTITTNRMRWPLCSTPIGTTRCWLLRMPAAIASTTAIAVLPMEFRRRFTAARNVCSRDRRSTA
jgi:hypothetical protein